MTATAVNFGKTISLSAFNICAFLELLLAP
jgi:hypothetical protein